MRIEKFKDTDMKRFIHSPEEQIKEIKKLMIPEKAAIDKSDIEKITQESLGI